MIQHESLNYDQFDLLKVCGNGATSTVVQAIHRPSGTLVALKHIPRRWACESSRKRQIELEINVLRTFRHKHVVRLFSFLHTADHIILVLEACDCSLRQLLDQQPERRFTPSAAVKYATEVAIGLLAMHGQGFVHGDIKPENVLLRKDVVKLSDFGCVSPLSNYSETTNDIKFFGTLDYTAPELLASTASPSIQSDVWALGATLCELLTGCPPFFDPSQLITRQKIERDEPQLSGIEKPLQELLRWMLQKESDRRPTFEQIITILNNLAGATHRPL